MTEKSESMAAPESGKYEEEARSILEYLRSLGSDRLNSESDFAESLRLMGCGLELIAVERQRAQLEQRKRALLHEIDGSTTMRYHLGWIHDFITSLRCRPPVKTGQDEKLEGIEKQLHEIADVLKQASLPTHVIATVEHTLGLLREYLGDGVTTPTNA